MAPAARKRPAAASVPTRGKRSKYQDGEDDEHEAPRSDPRHQRDANYDFEIGDAGQEQEQEQEQDGDELSTPAISELETDITTFIRSTGRNDSWPAAFRERVQERQGRLLERLRAGMAERHHATSTFRTTIILPFLTGCLPPVGVGVRPLDPEHPFLLPIPDPTSTAQPLATKSTALIQASTYLLREYAGLADLRVDTKSRDRLLATIAREERDVANAIKTGRHFAKAEIGALLGFGDGGGSGDGGEGQLQGLHRQQQQQGSSVLRVGAQEAVAKRARARKRGGEVGDGDGDGDGEVDSAGAENWGVVAAETVRAFAKLSKVVESD